MTEAVRDCGQCKHFYLTMDEGPKCIRHGTDIWLGSSGVRDKLNCYSDQAINCRDFDHAINPHANDPIQVFNISHHKGMTVIDMTKKAAVDQFENGRFSGGK